MSHTRDRHIHVGSIRARYWELGAGAPVLLIHGLGASAETWQDTVPVLAEAHHVYAVDLVGFGYSDKPAAQYTVDYLVDFIRGFMDVVGTAEAALIGHSLGGALVLRFAILHPDRVSKLVLVDSAGLSRKVGLGLRLAALPLVGELLLRPSPEKTRQALKPFFYDPILLTDAFVDLNYDLITQPGAQAAYLSTVRSLASVFGARRHIADDITARLEEIHVPTLVIWGAQDAIVPVAHADIARDRIANAQIHILPECGHMPMMEKTEEFNRLVGRFLTDS
jgi:pimeloyl-ACP methyl ester carboxylesterase